jgi:hypothetical protein
MAMSLNASTRIADTMTILIKTLLIMTLFATLIIVTLPYFIKYSRHTSIIHTFILQFYLNTLLMNKVSECYLPSIMGMRYFSNIFNEKSVHFTQ